MARELHTDIESRSELSLPDVGLDVYANHPSTQITLLGWAFDHDPVKQWELGDRPPDEFIEGLLDPTVVKSAHNAQFERTMFDKVWLMSTPIEQWRCSMMHAYMLGLPGSLDKLGEVLKLPEEFRKFGDGKSLIRKFCSMQPATKRLPRRWYDKNTHPAEWQRFREYNARDVEAERFICNKRLHRYPVSQDQWENWFFVDEVNQRGWPIDREMVENACGMVDTITTELLTRLKELTNLDNPNSDKQFGPWVRRRGYPFGDLQKATVAKVLADAAYVDLHEPLAIRKQLKKTSTKKYFAIRDSLGEGDNLRFTHQAGGASRTGRDAGRGAQMQNPAKCPKALESSYDDIVDAVRANDLEYLRWMYGDVQGALSAVIRGAVRATPGRILNIADLSSIETAVIAWATDCQPMLDIFRKGLDPYMAFGELFYRKPYTEVTKEQRNLCKPPMLGCGFRLSGGVERPDPKTGDIKKTGLWGYAENLGVKMTQEQCNEAVKIYRAAYPEVVQFWYDVEAAAKAAITRGGTHSVGRICFDMDGPFLRIRLPSGRYLRYLRPKIELRKMPADNAGKRREKWSITFEGLEDTGDRKVWGRQVTHGGKLTENIVQAIANDVLRTGQREARRAGFNVVGRVHDELVSHDPIDSYLNADELAKVMTVMEPWMDGLPLSAKGFQATIYRKD